MVCLEPVNIQIHGFYDTAKNAYGACVYLRSEDASGNVELQLICSKSRVAQLKTKSIPRLQLAKLTFKVTKALDTNIDSIHYWCDLTIVLCWLRAQSSALETFVDNRVDQIQDLTEIDSWRHVRCENNPADCISRGVAPNLLTSLKLWCQGPEFLFNDNSKWPSNPVLPEDVPGFKKGCNVLTKEISIDQYLFDKFNNLPRIVKIVAYSKRYLHNLKSKDIKLPGSLNPFELEEATLDLVRLSQKRTFQHEIKMLSQNIAINKGNLSSLNSFLDDRNILMLISASDKFTK